MDKRNLIRFTKNMAKTFQGKNAFKNVLQDAKKNVTHAAVSTVNIVAANARANAVENVQKNFTVRNTFTVRNIRYDQCPKNTTRIADIKAYAGVTDKAAYMERQETGGIRTNKNGGNLVIPTTAARKGKASNPVSRAMQYSQLKNRIVRGTGTKHFASSKARLVARAAVAVKTKGYIKMNDAIFSVQRFRAGNTNVSFDKKEIYNMQHHATVTPQKKWLEPASEKAARNMQEIYNSQIAKL